MYAMQQVAIANAGAAGSVSTAASGLSSQSGTLSQTLEAFQNCLTRIHHSLVNLYQQTQGRDITLSMLANDHEIIQLVKEIVLIAKGAQAGVRLEATFTFAERVFKRLSETATTNFNLRVDIFVGILETLRDVSGAAKKFAPSVFISWLNMYTTVNLSEESGRQTHRSVLIALLKAKLVRSVDIDAYFANSMDSGRNMVWVELALAFVRQCLALGIAATYEFTDTFDTVSKMRPTNANVRKQLQKWLTDLRALAAQKEEQKAQMGANANANANASQGNSLAATAQNAAAAVATPSASSIPGNTRLVILATHFG